VQSRIEKSKTHLQFIHLPHFAKFLLNNHLEDFVKEQMRIYRELDLPLLKFFAHLGEVELLAFATSNAREMLELLADNKAAEQIESARVKWMANQLPQIDRSQILAEDIAGISYARKQSFQKFIPAFAPEMHKALELISEIDRYMLVLETVFSSTHITLLNEQLTLTVKELRLSEQLYKQAQALAHVGNWTWDLQTNKLEWTNELYAIHGLDPASDIISYEKIASFNHPDDIEKVSTAIQEAMRSLQPYNFHYRIILPDGNLKHLHARGEVMVNEDGQPYKMLGTLQDVTERQELIEQLQLRDELYRESQALSHHGNWTWIIKENRILWSDELYRIFGMEPHIEEITFERYASFIHPEDKELLFNTIQDAMLSRDAYDIYHRVVRPDGSIRHINSKGRVELDAQGQPVRMLGSAQDVTLQKEIEQEARAHQLFIQKIADAAPSLISSYNVHTGQYRFISQGLKKLLGYDPVQPLKEGAQFFVNMVHPDDLTSVTEKNALALEMANRADRNPEEEEPIVEFEYRMRHVNGEYRWFQTYGTIFDRNSEGKVEHVLNISIDITERKEMETALSQKNLQLQQSNANLEEFAYVASHDLKEPLRKISIFGDRLLSTQYQYLGAEGQFFLEKIIDSSRRMQVLITDLLSLSLIAGNKSFVLHSLQHTLDDVLRMLEYKIEEKQAIIRSQPLPHARVIPSQFQQLFQNLLTNSLKFVQDGVRPEINISYRWLKPKDVSQYKLTRAVQYLEVTFADNGIGFDNMFAGKIFAIFQRLQHKEYEGTGIGLAICKKIVENHGGVIFAQGEPGKGASFIFIIPA
jgi:PAS domain S-box-containing protein